MAKSIYKYELPVQDNSTLELHGKVLSAGVQNGKIMIWAVHDDEALSKNWQIDIRGTGHILGDLDPDTFVGTVFLVDGMFVFHVFAKELTRG